MLAAGEAQPVIGMSHPLARQPGWGGGGRREREGGRKERKGREGELERSLRQRPGLNWVLDCGPLLRQSTQFEPREGGGKT